MTSRIGFFECLRRPALPVAAAVAVAVLAVLANGCGKSEPPLATTPAGAEIRGEPITAPVRPESSTPPAAAAAAVTAAVPPAESVPPVATPSVSGPAPAAAASSGNPGAAAPAPTVAVAVAVSVVAPPAPGGASPAPAAAPATATSGGAAAKPVEASGSGTADSPLALGFEKLASFQYHLPDGPVDTNTVAQAGAASQIPDTIKSLNNRFITLKGFMLPLKVEKGLVTELLIMRDQSMCCYGTVPRINEWVSVKMVGAGVKPIMDQAVTFFGKLKVGEMYENGYLVGIYALDGERMAGPLDM